MGDEFLDNFIDKDFEKRVNEFYEKKNGFKDGNARMIVYAARDKRVATKHNFLGFIRQAYYDMYEKKQHEDVSIYCTTEIRQKYFGMLLYKFANIIIPVVDDNTIPEYKENGELIYSYVYLSSNW